MVDVATGTLTPGRTIVVAGDRIVAVNDSAAGFAPARTVDATGRFALPGLWDMHVHFGGGEALIVQQRVQVGVRGLPRPFGGGRHPAQGTRGISTGPPPAATPAHRSVTESDGPPTCG